MQYTARIRRNPQGWRADFPDIPGLTIYAPSDPAIVTRAHEGLVAWLRRFLRETTAAPPERAYAGPGRALEVPGDVALAIDLRDARCTAELSQPALAHLARVPVRLVQELEGALIAPKLEKVIPLAHALGLRPLIELERPGEAVGLIRTRHRRGHRS